MAHEKGSGRYIDLYVTVTIAVAVGALGTFDIVGVNVLVSATLATLALTTVGGFLARRQVDSLVATTSELSALVRRRVVDDPSVDQLMWASLGGLDANADGAADVRLVGVTLSRTVRNHAVALQRVLDAGGSVRAVLVEPGGGAVAEAARRNAVPDSPEIFSNRVRTTLDLLRQLSATAEGRIDVRLLDFVPAYGLVAVDAGSATGRIDVEFYSHRWAVSEPSLKLTRQRDPAWFQHFFDEFDNLWARGRPMTPADGR